MQIKTIEDFYALMFRTRDARREIVALLLKGRQLRAELKDTLSIALESLKALPPDHKGKYNLLLAPGSSVSIDLTYEIKELEKDIFFINHGEEEFYLYLNEINPGLTKQVKSVVSALKEISFQNFITDRDGTINNYCGRYASSIQSAYNGLFLSRFAKNCAKNSTILTSAPLTNLGLADVCTSFKNLFILSGSKGREYFNSSGQRRRFPVESEKQKKLDTFNKSLSDMLVDPEFKVFSFIGSGLQLKFGQTTIARQDVSHSVDDHKSIRFLELIKDLVQAVDPEGNYLRIEDTGKDIEVILTIESDDPDKKLKDFDKGDAVKFLNADAGLGLDSGKNLICGDTVSDLPMLLATMQISERTWSVFVLTDNILKSRVQKACPKSFFVDRPDILVCIFNELSKHLKHYKR